MSDTRSKERPDYWIPRDPRPHHISEIYIEPSTGRLAYKKNDGATVTVVYPVGQG